MGHHIIMQKGFGFCVNWRNTDYSWTAKSTLHPQTVSLVNIMNVAHAMNKESVDKIVSIF